MIDPDTVLDTPPRDGLAAAQWLEQLAGIAKRAGLQRAHRRLVAIAKWAEGLEAARQALDAELEPPSDVDAPAAAPARDVHAELTPPAIADVKVRGFVAVLAKGPMLPAKIAKAMNANEADVKRWLKLAKNDGLVRRVGYRWMLVAPPVPAEPVRSLADVVPVPRATPHATSGGGPTCTRCDCPFSDHDPNSGKCFGKKGKCVCTEFYS